MEKENMNALPREQEKLSTELRKMEDGSIQCGYLLEIGIMEGIDEKIRREENRIPGCQTAIWQVKEWNEGRLRLEGDSDSLLVKGVLVLMKRLYQGRTREEIRANPPIFLKEIREEVIYGEIRQNGLRRFYEQLLEPDTGSEACC